MQLSLYQIDAFTSKVLGGNPAAVIPLTDWLGDELLQRIAAENNLSETAFFVPHESGFALRWFTPTVEVDLCGHATLASAFVVLRYLEPDRDVVWFETKSGELVVERDGDRLAMDLPTLEPTRCDPPEGLAAALGATPTEVWQSRDYLAVLDSEQAVRALTPDFAALARLGHCVIVTAPADGPEVDFVSRFFAPTAGIDEDPVTGSAHCTLTPYWAQRKNRTSFHAHQVSRRGGELWCEHHGARTRITGHAVRYAEATIYL